MIMQNKDFEMFNQIKLIFFSLLNFILFFDKCYIHVHVLINRTSKLFIASIYFYVLCTCGQSLMFYEFLCISYVFFLKSPLISYIFFEIVHQFYNILIADVYNYMYTIINLAIDLFELPIAVYI